MACIYKYMHYGVEVNNTVIISAQKLDYIPAHALLIDSDRKQTNEVVGFAM